MATLFNPLDKFASYSIHHVLLACRTTSEAKAFTDEAKNGPTLAAIDQVTQLGEAVPYGKGEAAYLVIDTRRFSQFTISSLKYEVLINGIEKAGSHGNLATNLSMTIVDAVGISFINFLQWMMDEKMKTNFDGMIFMLRVIFVGQNVDGTTETVQTVTIPMHLFKLELSLDELKGTYAAEFMPNMNFDVDKHQRWLNISSASRFFTGKGKNTLGDVVASFEHELNKESQKYYDQAQGALVKAKRTTEGHKYGRVVRYQISLPSDWASMKFDGPAVGNATETIFKKFAAEEKAKKDADDKARADAAKARAASQKVIGAASKVGAPQDTYVSVESGKKITEVLDTIFSQVKEIAQLGAGVRTEGPTGSVTFYKHFVGITSTEDAVVVHVDVVPFKVPNVLVDKAATKTVAQGANEFYQELSNGKRVPNNYAEFDYIFTGKNKDILSFDMKLQDLQFMMASNLNLGPGLDGIAENTAAQTAAPAGEKALNKRAELITTRAYDAILLPRNTEDELKNFNKYTSLIANDKNIHDVGTSQDYQRNLSMYYAMSPINVVMTIRGNPDIMAKFNQSSFMPSKVLSTASPTGELSLPSIEDRKQYRKEFEELILKNNTHTDAANTKVQEFTNDRGVFTVAKTLGKSSYATSPVFVKINIKGPKVNFVTGAQVIGEEFSETLLYDNFYVVFKVTNIIEGHDFKQQIELYSHNIFGMGKLNTATTTKTLK